MPGEAVSDNQTELNPQRQFHPPLDYTFPEDRNLASPRSDDDDWMTFILVGLAFLAQSISLIIISTYWIKLAKESVEPGYVAIIYVIPGLAAAVMYFLAGLFTLGRWFRPALGLSIISLIILQPISMFTFAGFRQFGALESIETFLLSFVVPMLLFIFTLKESQKAEIHSPVTFIPPVTAQPAPISISNSREPTSKLGKYFFNKAWVDPSSNNAMLFAILPLVLTVFFLMYAFTATRQICCILYIFNTIFIGLAFVYISMEAPSTSKTIAVAFFILSFILWLIESLYTIGLTIQTLFS
jgi:hypothetical protein